MTIVYVTTGAWGTGSGTPNSAAQVDGNFYDVDQRIVDLVADVAEGKRIDTVTYTSNSMTFHFTDGSSQIIPLPIADLEYVGEWLNNVAYLRGNMVSVRGMGSYQVRVDHTTPPLPATFDPAATDGSGNPLYQLWLPSQQNYDAAIFVPGSIQRAADELLWQGVANRAMRLPMGTTGAYAYLDTGNTGSTDVVLAIEKNGTGIGTITFATGGGQNGAFNIPAVTDFTVGDRYAIRVTQSDDAAPADLSVTLPFLQTDV
jgi:hypothetical protein